MKGDFSKDSGYGVCRYIYELYSRLGKITGLEVDKIEMNKPLVAADIETDGYDILHNPYYIQFPIPDNKNGKKLTHLVTVHDFIPLIRPDVIDEEKRRDWLKSVSYTLVNQIKNASCIIVNSTQTREEAISLGCREDKIYVINLGIDERFSTPIITFSSFSSSFGPGETSGIFYCCCSYSIRIAISS